MSWSRSHKLGMYHWDFQMSHVFDGMLSLKQQQQYPEVVTFTLPNKGLLRLSWNYTKKVSWIVSFHTFLGRYVVFFDWQKQSHFSFYDSFFYEKSSGYEICITILSKCWTSLHLFYIEYKDLVKESSKNEIETECNRSSLKPKRAANSNYKTVRHSNLHKKIVH